MTIVCLAFIASVPFLSNDDETNFTLFSAEVHVIGAATDGYRIVLPIPIDARAFNRLDFLIGFVCIHLSVDGWWQWYRLGQGIKSISAVWIELLWSLNENDRDWPWIKQVRDQTKKQTTTTKSREITTDIVETDTVSRRCVPAEYTTWSRKQTSCL